MHVKYALLILEHRVAMCLEIAMSTAEVGAGEALESLMAALFDRLRGDPIPNEQYNVCVL